MAFYAGIPTSAAGCVEYWFRVTVDRSGVSGAVSGSGAYVRRYTWVRGRQRLVGGRFALATNVDGDATTGWRVDWLDWLVTVVVLAAVQRRLRRCQWQQGRVGRVPAVYAGSLTLVEGYRSVRNARPSPMS